MAMSERAGMENIVMKRLLLVGAAFAAQIASATAADMAPPGGAKSGFDAYCCVCSKYGE